MQITAQYTHGLSASFKFAGLLNCIELQVEATAGLKCALMIHYMSSHIEGKCDGQSTCQADNSFFYNRLEAFSS